MTITLQPVTPHPHAARPYPFHVDPDTGMIGRQDFWRGKPLRVIGFARAVESHTIDLPWADAAADPERAVGMYVVTADRHNVWGTHVAPIESARRNNQ